MIFQTWSRGTRQAISAGALALGLAGCGGGVLVTPVPVITIDEGVLSASAGTLANPYVLPSIMPADTNGGIENYTIHGGFWRVNLEGQEGTTGFGTVPLANTLIHDVEFDEWILNIDGADLILADDGTGHYISACITTCAEFDLYDNDPTASQYGMFGHVYYDDGVNFVDYYAHAGMKTDATVMPTGGTGTYTGVFAGTVIYTDADFPGALYFDDLSGTTNITASFTGGALAFDSSGTGTVADSTYSLTGAAVITGNLYQGTITGSYDDFQTFNVPSLNLAANGAGSSLSGAFYGPDQTGGGETAGVVYATSAAGDANWGEIAGGFWAEQTSYTP